ncbi:Agamous-like MADS-box protein AGL36 [Linum perenne]
MRKRRDNILKKARELSILCGVQVLCIVYSVDEPGVRVWPSDDPEAKEVMARYMAMPEMERFRHAIDQETYLKNMIKKVENRGSVLNKKMNELELAWLMDMGQNGKGFNEMDMYETSTLSMLLKEKLGELRKKAKRYDMNTTNGAVIDAILADE